MPKGPKGEKRPRAGPALANVVQQLGIVGLVAG